MSQALYRKYRSKSLDEIVGQSHVTDVLARALKQGKIAHAYLLTGPRGTGKTSIARILAHEINQIPYDDESSHLDIIEIDAASNNGVDDVRELREKVRLAPVSARKKIYIIDEVHMLSKPAFNALLKTLEEPPEHVVFILATTNIEKLPDTIISRTQRFGFRAATMEDTIANLQRIAEQESIKIDVDAVAVIAERSKGSFRDSVSLLDQLSSLADSSDGITKELVERTLGLAPHEIIDTLLAAVVSQDPQVIITTLDKSEKSGIEAPVLIDQLILTVKEHIAEKPQLLTLLDGLLEASDSSRPAIKLLTVLLTNALPKQKPSVAALVAPSAIISAPVKTLASQKIVPQKPAFTPKKPDTKQPTPAIDIPMPARVAADAHPENFDWAALLEYTRINHVALHSVLSKCSHSLDGDTLTLYTVRKFNKTKLDDAKYRILLAEYLLSTGVGDLVIETIPTPAPPTDKDAAAVAAIMGGGEQVNVE